MEEKIKEAVWALFKKYNLHYGEHNQKRMEAVVRLCMREIDEQPEIKSVLIKSKDNLEFFVVQTVLMRYIPVY